MTYRIKEIYFTQQGEGKNTGKDFVFVRFSGCNLWSGKEKNRKTAICKFCDTDFYGVDGINGGIYEKKDLVKMIKSLWIADTNPIRVVLTGGEPLLQLDDELIQEGIVRDLVRQVQNIRKDAGFSVEDRINITWELDREFEDAISKFREYFCNETLTVSFSEKSNMKGFETDFSLRNKKIKLSIYKVNS